ncbi:translocation/assembly module TamB domain-containing protein [Sphingomonas radiodurans]|uniref:translocation/assembly module TamB domain-containing protein n=1 Tax=Sphingomonas radiodurans TaxID=2890321 RepID=UPI001E30DFC6|nr:translocation/assembly module TamB domain-containing protein [Sphingomonas radiodurans]WBH17249.1 translocation/assembly module TamB domain-containing protein [Sphingomonas radiodurans]
MRWLRWLVGALVALVAIMAASLWIVDTDVGHRWVAERINAVRPANGLRFTVGRIDGSLYGQAVLRDVRVNDPEGLVLAAPRAELDWRPFAWLNNRLDIRSLRVPVATLAKWPKTLPTKQGPLLPDFDIAIGRLSVERLMVARRVTGVARYGRLSGRADIRDGRAMVELDAVVEGSDRLALKIDAAPDRNRFDIDVRARGTATGVLARMAGVRRPLAVEVSGVGRWAAWQGRAVAVVGGARVAELALGNRAGAYTLTGAVVPASLTKGRVQRLTGPRVLVNGAATLVDRRLDGTLSLRSAALAVEATGIADLATSAWRNLRVRARLLRPPALFLNMTGRDVELRAVLDGPFATASFDYRITAARFAFDQTGFENARAAGKGRLSKSPVTLPVRFTAARVTGVGDVAGGILRNLSVDGVLRLTPMMITGDDLRLRSDKLTGRIGLVLDLRTGEYQVGLNGALGRYLIPGLGVVDVTSRLQVVPGPGRRGTRVVGTGTAQMVRLDNAFFRSLAGGLPRIVTGLERTPDGILHFRNLVLTGPSIRLKGNGYRRRDGTFHFEGSGRQASYGPLTLKLDGRIDRPTLDLLFERPNEAMGLRAVRAHLDPSANGFAFTAAGGSRLGPFEGTGEILLPRGGEARIAIARLDVSGTQAAGTLDIVEGGFAGRLAVAGGGIDGEVLLRPVGDVQRIETRLALRAARLADAVTLRSGRLDLVALLDPAGTSIEATFTGVGLRRGALSLARFAANAKLRDGVGQVRASIAGSRGRAFDIQSVIDVTADSYRIVAQGTVDRRPLRLETPAVLTRDGEAWRLAATRLMFAGGNATVSGRFAPDGNAIDATLAKMPLAVLDIGYPGLGLGGSASGRLTYASGAGGAPTGRIDMTVRGLTRSGLLLSSAPIDMGVAGVLTADRAGLRAVVASGGKTIGRGQAQLRLGGGDLAARLAGAGVFAQLRYDGPADTLWRLSRVELFDLSGPVSIAADVSGTVANPVIRGAVQAKGARIESATTGTVLSNVQAAGRFAGSRLAIGQFTADAGRGGRVSGAGRFDFAAAGGIGLDLTLNADKAAMINRDDIAATVTGPLRFQSNGRGGTISGAVRLDRSRYRLGQASATSAVPRLVVREINAPDGGDDAFTPPAPWRLDIRARAADQLLVTGLGLTSEWSADLTIGGAPDNPAITGRADLIRGDYEFAGREFQLERGVIRFAGETPANPALDIEANADSTGLSASIRVTGVALKPEITFSSVPALPQDELLSRLLFGTSITNLSAPEALQLAAAVAALRDGNGGLNPINAVRRAAGLDRLRILPADPQTGQGTSIAAGKYVSRRLYAEIVTDGQGYSATRVEFQVTRWLSLLSSISTLGRQSANVRISRDY